MIIIRTKNDHSSVENTFKDSESEKAFEYHTLLKQQGFEEVKWLHLPNIGYGEYVSFWTKYILGRFK